MESEFDDFLEELKALTDMKDLILLQLAKVPQHNHAMLKTELRKAIIPLPIVENQEIITSYFNTAYAILRAHDFIKEDETIVKLGQQGYKLLEVQSPEEIKKPYTNYINRKILIRNNKLEFIHSSIRMANTTKYILWLTLLITLISAVISGINLVHEYERDIKQTELYQKDSTIQSLQLLLFQRYCDTTTVRLVQ